MRLNEHIVQNKSLKIWMKYMRVLSDYVRI